MEHFEFSCPHCNTEISADVKWIGMSAKCPSCKKELTIPQTKNSDKSPSGSGKAGRTGKKVLLLYIGVGIFLICFALSRMISYGKTVPDTKDTPVMQKSLKKAISAPVLPEDEKSVKKTAEKKVTPASALPAKEEYVEKIPEIFLLADKVKLEMVKIPHGTFIRDDGKEITITRDFWLGKYELTKLQYNAIMKENFSYPVSYADLEEKDLPQDNTSWIEGKILCKKLNEKYAGKLPSGYHFSMPSTAQWEYACRAGTATAFSYGDVSDPKKMNFDGERPYGGAEPVKREELIGKTVKVGSMGYKNAFGLYDMHGNVSEWCLDYHTRETRKITVDPIGLTDGKSQPFRGGSYRNPAEMCLSSYDASRIDGFISYIDCGFRIALVPVQ